MNKKLLFLIILILLLVIALVVCGITIFVRFFTIESLYKKAFENVKKDNYYLKTIIKENDTVSTTEAYYRNDVGKLVAENKVYTWTDGEYAYMIDEESKTAYVLNVSNENAGLVSYDMFASVIPGYNRTHFERLKIAADLKTKIEKTYIEGKKYYILSVVDNGIRRTTWVDEEGKPFKAEIVIEGGNKIEYEYELKFHETKLKDLELPKMNDYKVIDTESKEVVKEPDNNAGNENVVNNTTNSENVINNTNTENIVNNVNN